MCGFVWLTMKWLQLNISLNRNVGRSSSREPSRQRRDTFSADGTENLQNSKYEDKVKISFLTSHHVSIQ